MTLNPKPVDCQGAAGDEAKLGKWAARSHDLIAQRTQRSDSAPTRGRRRGDWVPSRILGKQLRAKEENASLLQRRGRSRHGIGHGAAAKGFVQISARTSARVFVQISFAKRRQGFRNASSPSKRQGGCYLSDGGHYARATGASRSERAERASGASGRRPERFTLRGSSPLRANHYLP